jgi:uncharacterized protein with PQ loop repeat
MYRYFYKILSAKKSIADDEIYLLNEIEISYIKKCEKFSIIMSGFIGGIMVVILYLPQYLWHYQFATQTINLPFLNTEIILSFPFIFYGTILVFVELFLLMLLNIYCCHEIGILTGFINNSNKNQHDKRNFLLEISKQVKTKEIHHLGINPFLGLSRTSVFFLNLAFTLKASMSNFLIRLIFQKILGRYAFRIILDFLGIPIFAFWNAWGTKQILAESRIIILGVNFLTHFKNELLAFRELDVSEKEILYDTLQFIATSKRDYHKNHYELSKITIERFNIEIENEHQISNDYYNKVLNSKSDFKILIEKIIILGFILDGRISIREKIRIKKLYTLKIIHSNYNKISKISSAFNYGKGFQFSGPSN